MDWNKPVAKRTRQSHALYFKELHKRVKLERSSAGGSCYGRSQSGSEVGGFLEQCSGGGGGVGRNRKNVCERKGKATETNSVSDDDVMLVGCEERSVDKEGVSVDSDGLVFVGAENSGDEVELVGDGGNMEITSSLSMESEVKVEKDAVQINEGDENEERDGVCMVSLAKMEEDEDVVLISSNDENEDGEPADDVDSGRLSDSDYEINESSEEVEYDGNDDDGYDFVERPQKKIDCSNVPLESGKWIYWNEDQGRNGWIAYHTQVEYDDNDVDECYFAERPQKKIGCSNTGQENGKWIYWNEDQGRNGWIAYYTQLEYGSDLGDEESLNDTGVVKTGPADRDTQQNYSIKKTVKHNTHNDWVGTLKNNSPEFSTTSKSRSRSKMAEDVGLSQTLGEEEENDDDSVYKLMSKRQKIGINTILKGSRPPKYSEVLNDLVNSMMNDNDGPLEELAFQQTTVPANTNKPLPMKFTFGVLKTSPPEKTEFEKELDELWDEFDFALTASEIYSTALDMVDRTADSTPERATKNMLSYCHNGQHLFATDEEIGIKCKHCSFVKLEIRYLMPSFSKYPYRRFEKKHMQDEDDYVGFNDIPLEDVGCNSESDCRRHIYAKGTVWDLIPEIRNGMHPHQREGFEFIWKNIAGGIYLSELQKRTCSDSGNGCIISHAPGTGKSRLTIAFLQTYLKLYPACRPVIIAPRSMLLSWETELLKWKAGIPYHNLNMHDLSGKENAAAINLLGRADHDISSTRLLKLYSWKKDGGILGLTYKLFECLAGEKRVERKRKGINKSCHYDQEFRKILLETPNLIVLDEGHTPRNERSLIWKALCKIQTEKRIILSGTPFQNNFDELFNTLCLVRPKFADSIQSDCYEMRRRQPQKINAAKGKWFNLTSTIGKPEEGKVNSYKLEELRYMLDSFVHIYKGNILQKSLPGLRDSVIVLRPTEFQKRILEGVYHVKSRFERNYVASLVSVHPSLLPESERVHFHREKDKFERFRLNPEAGVKTKFLTELIRLSEATKEKVLVFSEYIDPLNFVRDQLKSYFGWAEGKEILYMDGKIDVRQRQSSINTFNDLSSEARVLLASKRACCEGINLVGASRVVLLDVVWNPSVERQAISRAYRLGQKRVVHVYQLISGTTEWEKYRLQAKKSLLSELVFSSSTDKEGLGHVISNAVSGDNILDEMIRHSSINDILEKIIHQPKESSLIETFGLVDQEGTF